MTPRLAPAGPADIDEIMRLERLPGNDVLVGRWPREEHEREMNLPGTRYLAWRGDGGALLGFAILQKWDSPHGNVHLRRIIVAEPGRGVGRGFLAALLDWVYADPRPNRLDLSVFEENERAWRAYARQGFVEEGVQREIHRNPDGSFRSMKLMSILRREWQARAR